jgi:hypothetical protein
MRICNQLSKIFIFLSFFLIISSSHAASGNISKTLQRGKSVTIIPNKCSLGIRSESTSRVILRCTNPSVRGSAKGALTLKKGKTATIKAKGCFLAVRSRSARKVTVSCLATRPTSTPTITPTQTPTSTITPTPTPTFTPNAQALTTNNEVISFNTSAPESSSVQAITGINSGEFLASIDRRPQNGLLYGLGYNPTTGTAQLYLISVRSGVATAVGSTGSFVDDSSDPVRIGVDALTKIGIDFNPTADRLRVVTASGQNFRINPNTGAFVDGNLGGDTTAGTNMDGSINGDTTTVGETAYTNNQVNQTVTTQYTIDAATDSLFIQTPPNAGTQTNGLALTELGDPLNIIEVRGFDIPEGVTTNASNSPVSSGSGFAVLEYASNSQQRFCSINLVNAAVTSSALINGGTDSLLGLAVQSASTPAMIALAASGDQLIRFRADSPGTTTTASITGVTSGEVIVGIDFRPSTGVLMGLGINATANTGTVYILDPQTGSATAVGTPGSIAFVDLSSNPVDFPSPDSEGYGFDFNPTVDRIRVVTGTGLNFRINPSTGSPVDADGNIASGINTDSAINGATTSVHEVSYTNSFASASVTTLYTLDASTDSLYIQNPANAGTQGSAVAVTLGGSSLDFSSRLGFEIPPSITSNTSGSPVVSGSGYGAFTVGGVTGLYSVNLVSGAVTNIGAIGAGSTVVRGLAVSEVSAN